MAYRLRDLLLAMVKKATPPTWEKAHRDRLKIRDEYMGIAYALPGSERTEEVVRLRTGYVCPECKESVLAFGQPKNCKQHE
jgi:hypothetical protein